MLELHHCSVIDWTPSSVAALATSVDGKVIAAARDSGAIEVWIVAPGAVGWHRQLVCPGKQDAAISSLVWCNSGSSERGRLFSGGLDGLITEWDLKTLRPGESVDSHGGSVWHLAADPSSRTAQSRSSATARRPAQGGGDDSDADSDRDGSTGSDDDDEEDVAAQEQRVAVACDDGSVRLFLVSDSEGGMQYHRTFPRVAGRILSVAWSVDGGKVVAGGSDGCIRCWDVGTLRELYRLTVGLGGVGGGSDICVWSLIVLRDGTIVSGDSTGSVQFWESRHGTFLQAHRQHKADVLALAAGPSHREVFAAGADGQVSLYRLVSQSSRTSQVNDVAVRAGERWVFLGGKRAHTHDVRAITVAYPLTMEEGRKREVGPRNEDRVPKPFKFGSDYQKWAVAGTPMLISGGNDAKLFTFPANSFLNFHPYDICTAPEHPYIQAVHPASSSGVVLFISQHANHVDLWRVTDASLAASQVWYGDSHWSEPQDEPSRRRGKKRRWEDSAQEALREVIYTSRHRNGIGNGNGIENENGNGNGDENGDGYESENGDVPQWKRLRGFSFMSDHDVTTFRDMRPEHLVRLKSRESGHITCSAISQNGTYVAYSCLSKTKLVHLVEKRNSGTKSKAWDISKVKLPGNLPTAHRLAFSSDSTQLIVAGPQGLIWVIDIQSGNVIQKFDTRTGLTDHVDATVSLLCTSRDGQWLAAMTTSGSICIYNLETLRHHWSMPALDGASVTAAVFHPSSRVLVVGTASNQLHVLDVEAKTLGDWSKKYGSQLPKEFLEFPGGLSGLSMPSWMDTTSLIVYSPRAMCQVDFSKPVRDSTAAKANGSATDAHAPDDSGHGGLPNGDGSGPSCSSRDAEGNFILAKFHEPVLFLDFFSENQVVVVEKPWLDVLRQMPPPVFRHLYGT